MDKGGHGGFLHVALTDGTHFIPLLSVHISGSGGYREIFLCRTWGRPVAAPNLCLLSLHIFWPFCRARPLSRFSPSHHQGGFDFPFVCHNLEHLVCLVLSSLYKIDEMISSPGRLDTHTGDWRRELERLCVYPGALCAL